MTLTLVTPLKTESCKIIALEVDSLVGNLVIQKGHVPTIITIKPYSDLIWTLPSGAQVKQKVSQGIADITRQGVTVIMEREV